jgi:hypothetical protein
VDRIPRLASLWLDRSFGVLRWAPLLALVFFAGWLLYRSRRDQLARVAPARREAEQAAKLALGIVGGQLVVTALAGALPLEGATFPGVALIAALPAAGALTSWGLRHVPRVLAAALAALTLGTSAWLLLGGIDGWLVVDTRVPWGPLVNVFPNFGGAPFWPALLCALLAAGLGALALREHRAAGQWRRSVAAARTSRVLH